MKTLLVTLCGLAVAFVASPAQAGVIVLPEPGAASLVGAIALAAVVIARLRRGQ